MCKGDHALARSQYSIVVVYSSSIVYQLTNFSLCHLLFFLALYM